jgi:hypothetical protein
MGLSRSKKEACDPHAIHAVVDERLRAADTPCAQGSVLLAARDQIHHQEDREGNSQEPRETKTSFTFG